MNTGSALAQFTVTLSLAVSEPVQVEWFTSDGTAKAGVDYAANKGTVVFAPRETSKTVDILVYGRAVGTEDRSFFVEMLPPTNAILGASIGECIIHVDTSGSTPVTAIIVPTGPKGEKGDPGEDGVSPDPAEIALEVAPLIDVGATSLTAEGTEALSKPDQTTVKAVARRVAYAAPAKIATVILADGDNSVGQSDMTGDTLDMSSEGLYPRIVRGSSVITPEWSIQPDGKILVKDAVAGDELYVCQYDLISSYRINSNTREHWARSLSDAGFSLVDGSFERGATVTSATDAVWHIAGSQCYVWQESLPKTVAEGSTPFSSGGISGTAWKSLKDSTLRSALNSSDVDKGDAIVTVKQPFSGSVPRSSHSVNSDYLHGYDFGIKADGSTDDTAALVSALSAAYSAKRPLKLPPGVIMVDANTLIIGDGSTSQSATSQGIIIEGSGFAPYTRAGTVIKARGAGDFLLKINGLIEGVILRDIQFDCAGLVNNGIDATTLVGNLWDGFGVYDWISHGVILRNRTQPAASVTWSRTNVFRRFFITTSHNEDYSSALHISGTPDPTTPPGPHDMHHSIFESGTIQMNKRPTANACQGIFLGFTDSNQFREIDVIMAGTGYGYGATFTNQDNPGLPYPQNNLFIGCSLGGDAPRVIGNSGRNYFFHYAMKDNESLPSDTYALRGMTDDGKFFGPHAFESIYSQLLLNGTTANERTVGFITPDGTQAAKFVHNSTLGIEVHVWNGSTYVTQARFHPDGSIYLNFPAIGFKKLEPGAENSAGTGYRMLSVTN